MADEDVLTLHRQGFRPAKIAKKLGLDRREVEALIGRHEVKRTGQLVKIIVVILAVALPLGLMAVNYFHAKTVPDGTLSAAAAGNLRAVSDRYLGQHGQEQWMLEGAPEVDVERSMRIGQIEKERLEAALDDHRNIPEVGRLAGLFAGKFRVAFFTDKFGGNSVSFHESNALPDIGNSLEVVLYARSQREHERIQDTFAKYDAEWHSLILGGIELTRAWYQALVIHELEHARLDREGASSVQAQMLSDGWISEEITAHLLEREVLNSATKGEYERILTEVVAVKRARSLEALFAGLTLQDLTELDRAFEPASQREAGIRAAQYLLDIGETWIGTKGFIGVEKDRQRIANYRGLFRATN